MFHHDHVSLLRKGISQPGGVWADLGAGNGAFTLALADLLGLGSNIYAIDKNKNALRQQATLMATRFPQVTAHHQTADFTKPLNLPPLDGIVMANSLHFLRRKEAVLPLVKGYLKKDGRLILVEYNTDRGNIWVPHPLAYPTWATLAQRIGFRHTEQIGSYPSRFLREIYSAVSW